MDEVTIDTYNRSAVAYDEETANFWDTFPHSFIESFVASISKPARVLNVGSGPGRDGSLLYAKGLHVVCLDASSEMVSMSKARGLLSVRGDFLHIPFDDDNFDGIWAYTSLLHSKKSELPKALAELRRILHSGGVLALGMIEGEGEGYRESSEIKTPRWFAFYSRDELVKLLTEAGFSVFHIETFQPKSKTYLNILARKS